MLAAQKNLTRPFYALLSMPATAMGFALSVQIAALSWILSTKYNLAIEEIGLVWAAGPLAGIFGQVIIGFISDRVWFWKGRRRPFILIGGVLCSLMLLALPNLDIINAQIDAIGILGIALIVVLTLDVSINISFNPTRSIIADVTPEGEERVRGYTWMQTISGSFGVLAYFIGAWLGNYFLIYFGAGLVLLFSIIPTFFVQEPRELLDSANSGEHVPFDFKQTFMSIKPLWGFLFYSLYALGLRFLEIEHEHYYAEWFCAIVTAILVAQTLLAKPKDDTPEQKNAVAFQRVLAAHGFTWIGVQSMFIYMYPWLEFKFPELKGTEPDMLGRTIGVSFLIMSAVSAILPVLVLQPLAEKYGRVKIHRKCIASMAVAYALIWLFADTRYALYAFMMLLGIGWASTISLPFAIISQQVKRESMGLYMGIFNLSVVLPQLISSLAVGLIVSRLVDKDYLFFICAICLAISAIAWTRVEEQH
ncbi:MAG: MFS transporter [Gammaproteobacteria bacterium]|nr:MFS transporter [Gammaproteobacteria bacterium]